MKQFKNFKTKVDKYIDLMVKDWSKKTIHLFRETLKQTVLEIEQADKLMGKSCWFPSNLKYI